MNVIEENFKKALKDKDELKISTLRLLKASIHNLEIERQRPLREDEIWQTVGREIKQRQEAIVEYQKGGRKDLIEKEKKEIEILSAYQPPQLSKEEMEKLVKKIIRQTGASSLADLGKVMKEVMSKAKGKVEGSKIAEIAKKNLGV